MKFEMDFKHKQVKIYDILRVNSQQLKDQFTLLFLFMNVEEIRFRTNL